MTEPTELTDAAAPNGVVILPPPPPTIVTQGGSSLPIGIRRLVPSMADARSILGSDRERADELWVSIARVLADAFGPGVWVLDLGPGTPAAGWTALMGIMDKDAELAEGGVLVPAGWHEDSNAAAPGAAP